MKKEITEYQTLIFDCDGVVLNSNCVKTDAFYQAALPYGEAAAQALVDYHVQNGGVSRYKKFAHFLESIVKPKQFGPTLEELLKSYADKVYEGLMNCEIAPGLERLKETTPASRWMIVSGGDQAELRRVFAARSIECFFNGGIFGSPDTKDDILNREIANSNIQEPALFLGDSKYDYYASSKANIDFIFISNWTEVENWSAWCKELSLVSTSSVSRLWEFYERNNFAFGRS
ncbi:HAD family hydrolase [Vreelandella populi]|uniref:HAD family hydrolase n=1 Tax=Vreelandella populi TaxID=2498858 RepID=A0A433LB57_9GAMM|nr:HAD hydrolase-like protein [Halomonas populi]RUR46001.1 HAD family hydrolase [Halomonas populi]